MGVCALAMAVLGGGRMNGVDEFADVVIAACDAMAIGQSYRPVG